MKKSNNLYGQKGKVLFTSAAAIALSLVAANPDKVSAATQPTNQAAKKTANIAKKRVTKKAAIQPTTLTTENSSEAVPNDSSNEEENSPATDKNKVESSSDPSATEPNDTPAKIEKRDSAPAERTVSGQVNGLNLSYNQDTDELSINGGSYDAQQYVNGGLATWKITGSDVSFAKAKKINITAATKLSGYATSGFFSNFAELTEITGLKLLDTSEAIYMGSMFANCPKLTSLDLSSLNTSNVTDMSWMFSGCSSLKQINLRDLNIKQVTDMNHMFTGDSALTNIDMFGLEALELTEIYSMFEGCTGLTEFTFPFTTPKLVSAYYLFKDCTNLRKLDISKLDLVSSGQALSSNYVDHMLDNLPKLSTLVLGRRSPLAITEKALFDQKGIDFVDWNSNLAGASMAFDSSFNQPWQQVDTAHGGTVFEPKGNDNVSLKNLVRTYLYVFNDEDNNQDPNKYFKDFPEDTYVRLGDPITLHHVDESGKPIPGIDDTKFCGPIGDSYNLSADQIPGYNLVGGDKTFSGNYNTSREVTAIYAKIPAAVTTPVQAADVTVHYQDENGKTIAPDEVLKGNVGDGYISMAKTVSGYTLKARPDNATGFFSASPQSVTYVYAQEGTAGAAEIAANGKGKGKNSKKGKNGKTLNNKPTAKGKTNSRLGLVPTGVNQLTSYASSSQASTADSSDPSHLPQTGTDKKTQIAVISAGAALLLSSLAGIWFSRKKN